MNYKQMQRHLVDLLAYGEYNECKIPRGTIDTAGIYYEIHKQISPYQQEMIWTDENSYQLANILAYCVNWDLSREQTIEMVSNWQLAYYYSYADWVTPLVDAIFTIKNDPALLDSIRQQCKRKSHPSNHELNLDEWVHEQRTLEHAIRILKYARDTEHIIELIRKEIATIDDLIDNVISD
jgi:hypothetical protein